MKLPIPRRDVERGDFARGQRLAEHADDPRPHRVGKLVETEVHVRARHFLQEARDVDDAEVVGAECPEPDDAEVLVPDHHRIGGAPFVAGEEPRGDEVHVGLEWRFESVLPALEPGQHRDVVGGERVLPWSEQIAVLSEIDELHRLRFPDDQLRAALDFLVIVREAERERVA